MKFTVEGGIRVSVQMDELGSEQAQFTFRVSDTGPGIDAQQATRLFDTVGQGDASSTRAVGGAGLGLAACRQLATQIGGDVGMESEPGRGSTFWLRVKLGLASSHVGQTAQGGAIIADRGLLASL